MLIKRGLLLLALLSLPLWAVPHAGAQEVNRVLAVVDDQVITSMDVEKMLRTLEQQVSASTRPGEQAPSPQQLRKLALERLIEDKVFELETKREKISVSKEELERFIQRVRTANNLSETEFLAQLSRRGLTMDEYRDELKKDILKHKLLERNVNSKVVVSNEQVEKAYQATYGSGGHEADQVRFRGIFLQVSQEASPAVDQAVKQRAEDLHQQALKGADFADLARKYSQGPGAAQGGEIGPLSVTDMLPVMRTALADLKPGGISSVVRAPSGYVIMQLVERGGPPATDASATQIKAQIRTKLENEAMEKRFQEWIKEVRSKTYIKVME